MILIYFYEISILPNVVLQPAILHSWDLLSLSQELTLEMMDLFLPYEAHRQAKDNDDLQDDADNDQHLVGTRVRKERHLNCSPDGFYAQQKKGKLQDHDLQ